MWPDRRIQQLFGIELPIVQAPMAGATQAEMVIGAARAGALGSLPCAMLSLEQVREQCRLIREATDRPLHLNFFCHRPPLPDPAREAAWRERLSHGSSSAQDARLRRAARGGWALGSAGFISVAGASGRPAAPRAPGRPARCNASH